MAFAAAILVMFLAAPCVFAVQYPVTWTLNTDYSSWATRPLNANDTLLFTYGPTHDVLVVSRSDYDNCVSSNAIDTHTGGRTEITLTTGPMYFICGTPNHCAQGMKLQVNARASSSGGSSPTPTTPTPSGTAATPPSSSSSPAGTNGAPGLSTAAHIMFGLPLALGTLFACMG